MTTECSWRLCPSPGMYTVTSTPLVRRTLATLRRAEFGFFGVVVYTRRQTPRFWGQRSSAGELLLLAIASRPFRTSWLIVGIPSSLPWNGLFLSYRTKVIFIATDSFPVNGFLPRPGAALPVPAGAAARPPGAGRTRNPPPGRCPPPSRPG